MIKISFTGDIMSSTEQDMAIRKYGSYNDVFSLAKPLFENSSYVIANLETSISGQDLKYTSESSSFNTPEEILPAIKNMGVDMVTNANNHILDRGIKGMLNTLDALDRNNLSHTGCYRTKQESEKIFVKEIGGLKVAILSFTYGTNSEFNGNILSDEESSLVDLLKKQPKLGEGGFQTKHKCTIKAERILRGRLLRLYNKLERKYFQINPYIGGADIDTVNESEIGNPEHRLYIVRLLEKVKKAREKSDIVILCLHCGGQYNNEIGMYTQYVFDLIKKSDVDVIIGNHPHCVLGNQTRGRRLYAYSLGNFSFTPGGKWYVDTVHAEYSIVLHVYIDEDNKRICRYTYSVIKNVIDKKGISRVVPVYEIKNRNSEDLLRDIKIVTKRFSGKSEDEIKKEYLLKQFD